MIEMKGCQNDPAAFYVRKPGEDWEKVAHRDVAERGGKVVLCLWGERGGYYEADQSRHVGEVEG